MAIDMSQFYQVFFDESDEHLAQMEALLVALDLTAPDSEDLNAIFRAAHSIKGSSGTFGFDDMMQVTHVMETLLDRVRKGELALSTDMVDACLSAGDVLRAQLVEHRGGQKADPAAATQIRERLGALCDAPSAPPSTIIPRPKPAPERPADMCRLELRFVPDPQVAGQRELMSNMLEELGRLGAVEVLEEPLPEALHGQWRLAIDTLLGEAEVREVLDFMADPRSVVIVPLDEGSDSAPTIAEETDDEDEAFGFFDLPAASAAEDAEDEAFGFFGPLPVVSTTVAEAPSPVAEAPDDAPASPSTARKPKGDNSIRVSVDKVDQLINMVGELVITQAMLQQSSSRIDPIANEALVNALALLERNTRELQSSAMSIRMMPISSVFTRFPRVVRDLSQKLGKQVELKTRGETTELDRGLIERIADPLTHLVRNSLDHGIETPETRLATGKPASGTITLAAAHKGGNVVVEVIDDGAGLDRERILDKARERGIAAPDTLSDGEVWQLIFAPGFSTAAQITEVSGRGVGMDVVKKNISALGGRVEIESMAGVGTRIAVHLPLTLAILDGMSVRVGAETYIVPLNAVVESLQVTRAMVHSISGVDRLIQVRGEYLTVVPLYERFAVGEAQTDWSAGIMVVVETDGIKAALFVDELIGQHQVVIKSLEANFRRVDGISGATIMGDGRVALILDTASLVAGARQRLRAVA
ncbi:MAG: chemotaxis protein CheW [Rhodocyclaceae bacterium]|nr:chemotaxis protein CheW [Rhodocyclaceae bacterium]